MSRPRRTFDLDTAIATWRRTLEHRRGLPREDLDELACHVRDFVEDRTERGWETETAFRAAVRRFGPPDEIETEYRKIHWKKLRHRHRVTTEITRRLDMLKNFARLAIRNLLRHKGHAIINILGLAVGLACCVLIFLFISDAWQHDRFHEKADRIYRVDTQTTQTSVNGEDGFIALSSRFVADVTREKYPEVERAVRLISWNPRLLRDGRYFDQDQFFFADPTFFDVFSFRLLQGDPQTALSNVNSVVLTESMQQRYFGDEPAMGQILVLNDSVTVTVTGIVADPPEPSHFTFDALVSSATHDVLDPPRQWVDWADFGGTYTYLLLREGADVAALEQKMASLPMDQAGAMFKHFGLSSALRLEPLLDIYLRGHTRYPIGKVGDIRTLYVLGAIALFLLAIASINFVNLSTARSVERAREVGVRKLVGARRSTLVLQFMAESLATVMLAFLLAMCFVALALPAFDSVAGKAFTLGQVMTPGTLLAGMGLALAVGLLAGAYPAVVLSAFKPARVLKGRLHAGRYGARMRKGLVAFQFALSVPFVVGTVVVVQQLRYMQNERLGFDAEQVLVLDVPDEALNRRASSVTEAFASSPAITTMTLSNVVPGQSAGQGIVYRREVADENLRNVDILYASTGYVETMGIQMVAGRPPSAQHSTDDRDATIINQSAVASLGYSSPEEALGQVVVEGSDIHPLSIVGVFEDYHHVSAREKIDPLLIRSKPSWSRPTYHFLSLRLHTNDLASTMEQLETKWDAVLPGYSFNYFFLDDAFDRQYANDRRAMHLVTIFAGIALFVACLGLFGLASFMASRRRKEMGVRKVLGASAAAIVRLLSMDFAKLVGVGIVIGALPAYVAAQAWLQDYAYRTALAWWLFPTVGLAVMTIALLTVSYQAIRAARADPVKTLRYE